MNMKKFVSYLVKSVAALTGLIVIAIICVVVFVNPNNYKDDISKIAHKYTGRTVTINGNISWSFIPLALKIQDVELSNTQDFKGPILKVSEAKAQISLINLIKGNIAIEGIQLIKPELYLIKTKEGKTNFDDLISSNKKSNPKKQQSSAMPTEKVLITKTSKIQTQNNLLSSMIISDFTIKNGKISWWDLKNPTAEEISFSTNINANMATQTFNVNKLQINYKKINLTGTMIAKISNKIINVDPINIEVLQSKHIASLQIDLNSPAPSFHFKRKTNVFQINKLLAGIFQFNKLHGYAQVDNDLKARGNDLNSLKSSLKGNIELSIKQGSFDGININKMFKHAETSLNDLFNTIKGSPQINIPTLLSSRTKDWKTLIAPTDKTFFDILSATATFNNGISQDTKLNIQHKDYEIIGNGEINLVNESLYLKIEAFYKNVDQNNNKNITTYILNTPFTIFVYGDMFSPNIKFDVNAYFKQAIQKFQKELFKDVIKKTINNIIPKSANTNEEENKNPLNDLGRSLFNNLIKKDTE